MNDGESTPVDGVEKLAEQGDESAFRDRVLSVATTLRARPKMAAAVLFVVVSVVMFVVYAMCAPVGLLYFDEPGYAGIIADANLNSNTIHIGYYLVGIPFTRLVPLDFDYTLNLMSALFSAMSLGLTASITYSLTRKLLPALAASAVLMGAPFFVAFAFDAEIYAAQLFFLLLATRMLTWDKPVAAGVSLAFAFLVSASSIFVAPFFLLLKPDWRFSSRWALPASLVSAGVLLPVYREYLWGERGMLKLQPADVNVWNALPKEWAYEIGSRGALIVAPFVVAGLVSLCLSKKQRRLAYAIPVLWLFPFLFGERYLDVPVQMLLWAMLAVISGVGLAWMTRLAEGRQLLSIAVTVVLFAGAGLSIVPGYSAALRLAQQTETFREQLLAVATEAQPTDAIVAVWPSKAIAEYYVRSRRPSLPWIDYEGLSGESGLVDSEEEWRRFDDLIASQRRLWIIDTPPIGHVLGPRGYRMQQFAGAIYIAEPAPIVQSSTVGP